MINSPATSVWIGYDPRQSTAFAIAKYSLKKYQRHIPIMGLVLDELREQGLYRRPTSRKNCRLWDDISEAPMATEFSISRFLVPHLAKIGYALFCDCDVMFMTNVARIFDKLENGKAVYCVKHKHDPGEQLKMDNQIQTKYFRKNWSSVMLFNCDHPSNKKLTLDLVNTLPGRDLHRFCWLEDDEIGELPPEWNYLVGSSYLDENQIHAIVHFTNGLPDIKGYEDQEYAKEWRAMKPLSVGAFSNWKV